MENSREIETPYFLISEKILTENLKKLDFIQKESQADIILALKAFSNPFFFPLISQTLKGTTASSVNEARLAQEFNQSIHIYSPAYKQNEIKPLAEIGTHITFNSLSQYLRYKQIVKSINPQIQIGIRLNPEQSEVSYALYDPCCPHSRLGITQKELERSQLDELDGAHVHNLCGKNVHSLQRTLESIEAKFPWLLSQIKWLNLGGGHGLTYPHYEHLTLIKTLKDFQKKHQVKIILEPGEGIVYNCGVLVSSVIDIVHNEMDIAILDTSASAHMPDILEMPYRPHVEGSGKVHEKKHSYRLGGVTCLAGDIMGDYSFDSPLKIGDQLTFTDMAHYTMVKNTWFNGLMLPSIAKERLDGSIQLLKQYSYADYRHIIG